MRTAPITDAEREKRALAVSEAAHSSAMEGLTATSEFHADAAEYVEGTVDIDELLRRTKHRHGLPIDEPEARL